jgi:hypothetical protein
MDGSGSAPERLQRPKWTSSSAFSGQCYPYAPVIEADYLTRVTDSLLPLLREALNQTTNLLAEGNTPTGAYSTVMKHLHGSRQVHYDVFSANARSGRS